MTVELFIVVSSPVWDGDLVSAGYNSQPMPWDAAVALLNRSIDETVILAKDDNVPLYWIAANEHAQAACDDDGRTRRRSVARSM